LGVCRSSKRNGRKGRGREDSEMDEMVMEGKGMKAIGAERRK